MRLITLLFLLTATIFAQADSINVYNLTYPELQSEYPSIKSMAIIKASANVHYIVDKESNFFKIIIDYPFGSINDRKGFEGETYLTFNTLISGGSKKYPVETLDSLKDVLSISIGASVSQENATISMSCLKEKKDIALDILEDIITSPAFDSATLAINKLNIKEDIIREIEEPASFASKKFKLKMYGDNAYGNSIYGDTISLKKISVATLKEQYKKIKFVGNLMVGIVGDVSMISAPIIAWKALGNCNKKPAIDAYDDIVKLYNNNANDADVIFYNKADLNQTVIRWGNRGVKYSNDDYYRINMATSILGGGSFTSRLMEEIRVKRGLSYSVGYGDTRNSYYNGYFSGSCQTKTESTVEALKVVMNTTDEYINKGITENELAQFKKTFINNMPFLYDSYAGFLNIFMNYTRRGQNIDNLYNLAKIYDEMTVKDINKTIKKYISPSEKMTYIMVGNYEKVKDDLAKVLQEKHLKISVIEAK